MVLAIGTGGKNQERVGIANRNNSSQNIISCAMHSEPRCGEEARKNQP